MSVHVYRVRSLQEIPVRPSKAGGRKVDVKRLPQFWKSAGKLRRRRGCYVFALQFSSRVTIYYVGRATKQKFEWECFTPHKLGIYNEVLAKRTRRRPLLFFVTPTELRGTKPTVAKEIALIEKWLIRSAKAANPSLRNKILLGRTPSWRIAGVEPRRLGKASRAAQLLRRGLASP